MRTLNVLLCTVVLLLMNTLTTLSQTNYLPASITFLNGTKQEGQVDYREWRQNPRKINFKDGEAGQVRQYTVADLTSFLIIGKDSFERAVVKKDMAPVTLQEVMDGKNDTTAIDTVFLRILMKGPVVELYQLVDEKPHYYTKDKQGTYEELTYRVSYDNVSASLQYKRTFRNQLQRFSIGHKEEKKLNSYLLRANYQERDLLRIVALINDQKVEKKKSAPINFFVAAGPTFSNLKVSGPNEASRLDYKSKVGFTGGLGMDIASSRNLQDLIIRVELFYSSLSYEGKGFVSDYLPSGANSTYTLKQNNITPSLSLLYNLLRKPTWKVYLGAGIDYNISSYPENKLVRTWVNYDKKAELDNYFDLEKSWVSVTGRVGGIIANRFEVCATANLAGGFERFNGLSIKPYTYTCRVGYRFKK